MAVGIGLGALLPQTAEVLNAMSIAQVNIPIAFLLFGMMYPIMVQIDFSEIVQAFRNPKPVALTLIINWGVKPFTMLFFAWLFFHVIWAPFFTFEEASSYIAGLILLGIAPCTAMVLVFMGAFVNPVRSVFYGSDTKALLFNEVPVSGTGTA
ncbi:MAG: hypothetical protein C4575_02745 [Desulforudis sp.]|jgi:ACR3 family arsenite transporter|nr:MAG: hypothetical protein C4575_02745 [Desulforudis sp.]